MEKIVVPKRYVVVAGNVGAGKTEFVSAVASVFNWQPFYEPHGRNPFLWRYYLDPKPWGFRTQAFFLGSRILLHQQIDNYPRSVIQDRSIWEDAYVFARALQTKHYMTLAEYHTYQLLFQAGTANLHRPDLVVYIRTPWPICMQRIGKRGRKYEKGVTPAYIRLLDRLYEEWIAGFDLCPVLVIPGEVYDWRLKPDGINNGHLELVASMVDQALHGVKVVTFD